MLRRASTARRAAACCDGLPSASWIRARMVTAPRWSGCSTWQRRRWAVTRPSSSAKTANRTDVLLIDASVWVAARDPEDRFHSDARAIVLDFGRPAAAMDL